MANNELKRFPKWLAVFCFVAGVCAFVWTVSLIVSGEFTFKGSFYSATETPIIFWLHITVFLFFSVSSLLVSFLPDSWFS